MFGPCLGDLWQFAKAFGCLVALFARPLAFTQNCFAAMWHLKRPACDNKMWAGCIYQQIFEALWHFETGLFAVTKIVFGPWRKGPLALI